MDRVVDRLKELGYDAELVMVEKPDGQYEGITIRSEGSNLAPTIYTRYLYGDSVDELVSEVIKIYSNNKMNDIDPEEIFKDIETKAIVVLYPHAPEGTLKRPYLDLEEVVKVTLELPSGQLGTVTIKEEHLKHIGMTEDELFAIAERNSKKGHYFTEISNVLPVGILGDIETGMYVVSNEASTFGGNALLNIELMRDFCEMTDNEEIYIIPSSVHELIFITSEAGIEDTLNEMINTVNATQLEPVDILSDHIYIYNIYSNEITY